MAKHSVEIEGLNELLMKLTALGGNAPKAIHDGLVNGGKVVQGVAKETCATDTEELRNSIVVKSESQEAVTVGTNKPQGVYTEFGTGTAGDQSVAHKQKDQWFVHESQMEDRTAEKYHFPKIETEKGSFYIVKAQEPQPFLSPALSSSKDEVKRQVANAVKQAIKEACNNG